MIRLLVPFVFFMSAGAQSITALEDFIRNQAEQGFSGSVLVAKGNHILVNVGVGMENGEVNAPNKPTTKFRIASITKQFTATAIMQLAEAGKLRLQDLACQYVQDCPDDWKSITIYQLLTHTAGVYDPWWLPEFYTPQVERVPRSPTELLMTTRDMPLSFAPGTGWAYSNANYFFLGLIVEKVSAEQYANYLQKHIFEPLGMVDTGYDDPSMVLPNRASGYTVGPSGLYNATYIDTSLEYSAAGLYSTVADMYRWDRSLYTDQILSRASRDAMFAGSLLNPIYGFGFYLSPWFGHKQIGHGGWTNGFLTYFARFPDDDAAVIVFTNIEGGDISPVVQELALLMFETGSFTSPNGSALTHSKSSETTTPGLLRHERPIGPRADVDRFSVPLSKLR